MNLDALRMLLSSDDPSGTNFSSTLFSLDACIDLEQNYVPRDGRFLDLRLWNKINKSPTPPTKANHVFHKSYPKYSGFGRFISLTVRRMGAIYIPYDMVTPTQSSSPTSSSSVADSLNHVAEITAVHTPSWEVEPYRQKNPSSRRPSDQRGRRDPCTTLLCINFLANLGSDLATFGDFSSKQSELPHYGSHINVMPPPSKRRKTCIVKLKITI
jgi:hypothetical protein